MEGICMAQAPTDRPPGRPQKPHTRVSVRMPLPLHARAVYLAELLEITVPQLIRTALDEYFQRPDIAEKMHQRSSTRQNIK